MCEPNLAVTTSTEMSVILPHAENYTSRCVTKKSQVLWRQDQPKTKKGNFRRVSAGRQYSRGILPFLAPDLAPDDFLCMDVEDKGSI